MGNRFLFSSLSSSAQSCPVRFETIPLSVTDSACYHVSTQDFCYWNSEKCLYLEDIYIVAIDGNNPFSCCRSVSVILTYTKTSQFGQNAYWYFSSDLFKKNVLGKTKPNSEIHSAGTHRGFFKRMRKDLI